MSDECFLLTTYDLLLLQSLYNFRLCWCSSPTILLEGWSLAVCEEHKQRRLKFQFKIFILLY